MSRVTVAIAEIEDKLNTISGYGGFTSDFVEELRDYIVREVDNWENLSGYEAMVKYENLSTK